ncbi:hypothetical protein VTH82DRAFT_1745 [Thermothelomyces myriococcoides]
MEPSSFKSLSQPTTLRLIQSYMYPVCVLSQNGSSANNSARGFGARIGAQNKPLPRAGFGSETSGAKDQGTHAIVSATSRPSCVEL